MLRTSKELSATKNIVGDHSQLWTWGGDAQDQDYICCCGGEKGWAKKQAATTLQSHENFLPL